MSTPYRIVVGTDFSDLAARAFEEAIALAGRSPDPELHAVAVVHNEASELVPGEDRHASMVQIADHVRERLAAETTRLLAAGGATGLQTIVHVRVGPIAEQLAGLAGEIGADLVVVGTHGRRGLRRVLLGSVAERTVRLAPCPVLVVRSKDVHVMDDVPALEPPCPDCVKARQESQGARWWCEAHVSQPVVADRYGSSYRLDQPATPAPYG